MGAYGIVGRWDLNVILVGGVNLVVLVNADELFKCLSKRLVYGKDFAGSDDGCFSLYA
jgi:hypothetical protein